MREIASFRHKRRKLDRDGQTDTETKTPGAVQRIQLDFPERPKRESSAARCVPAPDTTGTDRRQATARCDRALATARESPQY